MPVTPIYAIPYQALSDAPDGAALGQGIAEATETELSRIDGLIAAFGPSQAPFGKMSRAAANQSIPNATIAQVMLDTLVESSGVTVSIANGELVIVTPGVYSVKAVLRWANASAGDAVARITKNDVGQAQAVGVLSSGAQGGLTLNVGDDIRCAAGDVLGLVAFQDSGAALDVATNFGGTSLAAHWVRS